MNEERFNELVNLFLDKAINDDGVRELRQAIDTNPVMKEAFIRRYQLHRASTALLSVRTETDHPQPALGLLSFAAAGSAMLAFAVVSLLVGLSVVFESQQSKVAALSSDNPSFVIYQPTSRNVNIRRIDSARARFASEMKALLDSDNQAPAPDRSLVKVDQVIRLNDSPAELLPSQQQWPTPAFRHNNSDNSFSRAAGFGSFQTVLP
jgi:hypothetical protein